LRTTKGFANQFQSPDVQTHRVEFRIVDGLQRVDRGDLLALEMSASVVGELRGHIGLLDQPFVELVRGHLVAALNEKDNGAQAEEEDDGE
jgi:hypothetical protein